MKFGHQNASFEKDKKTYSTGKRYLQFTSVCTLYTQQSMVCLLVMDD